MKIAVRSTLYSELDLERDANLTGYFSVDRVTETSCNLRYTDKYATSYSIAISADMLEDYEVGSILYSPARGLMYTKNTYNSKDYMVFYKEHYGVVDNPSARLAKSPMGVALVLYGPTAAGNWTPESNLPQKNMPNHELIDTLLPGFSEVYGKRISAKAALMLEISALDSLSALEKQVDMLTEIVYNNINGISQPDWAFELFRQVDTYSAAHTKPSSDILLEITSTKSKLRKLQKEYFESLGAYNG